MVELLLIAPSYHSFYHYSAMFEIGSRVVANKECFHLYAVSTNIRQSGRFADKHLSSFNQYCVFLTFGLKKGQSETSAKEFGVSMSASHEVVILAT